MEIKYTRVEYSKTFNLGNYENERIGLTAEVTEQADMLSAINKIRDDVEAVHNYRRDLKRFEHHQYIVNNPESHYGRDVTNAEKQIEEFYAKYPFHRPEASVAEALQLAESPIIEFKDDKQNWEEPE